MPAFAPARRTAPPWGRRCIVLLLCLSLGLHWVLLQGVAWTGMLVAFSAQGSVSAAVEKTFDGQHPCALCATVKQGQDSAAGKSQPKQAAKTVVKLDAVLVASLVLTPPASMPLTFPAPVVRPLRRTQIPETPPPRQSRA